MRFALPTAPQMIPHFLPRKRLKPTLETNPVHLQILAAPTPHLLAQLGQVSVLVLKQPVVLFVRYLKQKIILTGLRQLLQLRLQPVEHLLPSFQHFFHRRHHRGIFNVLLFDHLVKASFDNLFLTLTLLDNFRIYNPLSLHRLAIRIFLQINHLRCQLRFRYRFANAFLVFCWVTVYERQETALKLRHRWFSLRTNKECINFCS
uniref:(northern house mosquito) hypothetical protein n=1 Tax=Culex pipiens TaxID=7175 RepID=A0A8D8DKE7_CULPI